MHGFSGLLEAVLTGGVHPRVGGYVNSAHFTEGSHVSKGELLFEIDPRPFQRELSRLEAERRRAESQLVLAKADRARAERLTKSGAIAPVELERMAAREAEAAAAVDSTRASLSLARLDLEFAAVRAPIDGRVSRALVTPGNLVSPSSVLTTMVSDGAVYVYFDIDGATYLAQSRAGKEAKAVRIGLIDEDGYPRNCSLGSRDNQADPRPP